jgi:hypothetical protein
MSVRVDARQEIGLVECSEMPAAPLEMLKMKIDPAMFMKTHETVTKYHAEKQVFCKKML